MQEKIDQEKSKVLKLFEAIESWIRAHAIFSFINDTIADETEKEKTKKRYLSLILSNDQFSFDQENLLDSYINNAGANTIKVKEISEQRDHFLSIQLKSFSSSDPIVAFIAKLFKEVKKVE